MTGRLAAPLSISSQEYAWIQAFLLERSGIKLKEGKQSLVIGRLERRLRHFGLSSFSEYFMIIGSHTESDESQIAINLMTTNETYFFREPQHFERLPGLLPAPATLAGRPVRIWSAASSTGEEAYTIALTLADALGDRPWEILGTDLSTQVIETAQMGLYPLEATEHIPQKLLRAYCIKGGAQYEGLFALQAWLRSRVVFQPANLTRELPDLGLFDVVFLRNVMIYFGPETKQEVLDRIVTAIRPGGYFVIGHAETLAGLKTDLVQISPSLYRAPSRDRG